MDSKTNRQPKKRGKILIVDEIAENRSILRMGLEEEYEILEVVYAEDAIEILQKENLNISLVLLDINMPEMDGLKLLEKMNETKRSHYIPVVAIATNDTDEVRKKGYELGVIAYVEKPYNMKVIRNAIRNVIDIFHEKNMLEKQNIIQNRKLENQALHLHQLNQNLTNMLGTVVEFRTFEGAEHVIKVKEFSRVIGNMLRTSYKEYQLTEEKINRIVSGASLHDIGKIMIPETILMKPGKLTIEEFEMMKSHTTKGCEILEQLKDYIEREEYQDIYDICRFHHEKYDGSGYPDGRAGEMIPVSAQIVAVAETLDALISDVVYRRAYPFDEAIRMILEGNCGVYSPKILECMRLKVDELKRIAAHYQEQEV